MATVVRRYQRVRAPLTVQLARLLPAGAFVSSSAPLPGEFVDLSLNNAITNYAADADEIMVSLGFSFVAENPVPTLAAAAAAAVPPVTSIRESSGPTDLTIGAVANGQFLQRSGTTLVGGSSGAFDLRDVIVWDHFLSGNVDTDEIGWMGWRYSGTGTGQSIVFSGEPDRPGIMVLNSGTAAAARAVLHLGEASVGGKVVLAGTNPIVYETRFRFPVAGDFSATFLESCHFGFSSNWGVDADPTTGLFIRFAPAAPSSDATYKLVAITGGTATVLASTVAPVAGAWVTFVMTFTPGTGLATLSINGTPVAGSISTNIPTSAPLAIGFCSRSAGGGAPGSNANWDYVFATQDTT